MRDVFVNSAGRTAQSTIHSQTGTTCRALYPSALLGGAGGPVGVALASCSFVLDVCHRQVLPPRGRSARRGSARPRRSLLPPFAAPPHSSHRMDRARLLCAVRLPSPVAVYCVDPLSSESFVGGGKGIPFVSVHAPRTETSRRLSQAP